MSDTLFEVEASHAIYVNRLASKQVNDLNHFWLSYLSAMQSALENYAPDMRKSELNRLIAEINEVITFNMSDVQEQLFIDLQEFGEYETQFQAKAIGAAAGQSLALPATEQVIAAAIANPINMGKAGAVSLKPWLANITTRQKQFIEGEIKLGYANGVPTHQIIQSIVGTKSAKYEDGAIDLSRKATTSLVRTAVNHYATTARDQVFEKNKRVVIGYRIISTLDSRTSVQCRGRDSQEIIYSETKQRPKPPFHPNCLAGDTCISTSSRISNVYRRAYKGVMVDIKTSRGNNISITPNHPILTSNGWIAAGLINCGDKVATVDESKVLVNDDENRINASFSDIFSSLYVSVDPSLVAVTPSSAEHFHGDGVVNHDVDIINTDSLGCDAIKAIVSEEVKNNRLPLGQGIKLTFNSFSPLDFGVDTGRPSSGCSICSSNKVGNLFWSGFCHSCVLLLGSIPKRPVLGLEKSDHWGVAAIKAEMDMYSSSPNAALVGGEDRGLLNVSKLDNALINEIDPVTGKYSLDDLLGDAKTLGDRARSNTVNGVLFDDVVSVTSREVDSFHVYNLENDVNWYLSNGIVTHNCRTATTPIVKGRPRNLTGERASRGGVMEDGKLKGDPKPISSATDYYEFLAKQPPEFVHNVLGKTIGDAFLKSGVSPADFQKMALKRINKPMTIKEVMKYDKKLHDYIESQGKK